VDHRAADAAARVVLAHLHRVLAPDDALLVPVDVGGALLVADPVFVRVPERPGVEDDDLPPLAGEALGEGAAARSAAGRPPPRRGPSKTLAEASIFESLGEQDRPS
jgi:hypothetical protein